MGERRCDQETCPNWDGFSCPCSVLGICMYCKGQGSLFIPEEDDHVECGYCDEASGGESAL